VTAVVCVEKCVEGKKERQT